MSPELATTIIGLIAVPVALAAAGWAFSINTKLGSINENLKGIPELWRKIEQHGEILMDHKADIGILKDRVGWKKRPPGDE